MQPSAVPASSSSLSSSSAPTVGGLQAVLAERSNNPFHYGSFPTAGRHPHSLRTSPMEHCAFKALTNAVIGAGLGVVVGVFTSSMGTGVNSWSTVPGGPGWIDPSTLSTKEALKLTAKDMWRASKGNARTFGLIGGVLSGIECAIEKERGKHDMSNRVAAGCITGGLLGVKGGPQAAALGCVGFAAFGYAIDRYMDG